MKTKDIARQHGLDASAFDAWIRLAQVPHRVGMTGISIDDNLNVDEVVHHFKQYAAQEQARVAAEQQQAERAAQVKQQALAGMLITSGFNFDGYRITRYSGYISGDDAVSMDRPRQGWLGGVNGDVAGDLMAALAHIRRRALAELKEAAYALGCNAVIGVDFDYLTLDPETVSSGGGTLYLPFLFAVTANGNAVVIEKSDRAGS